MRFRQVAPAETMPYVGCENYLEELRRAAEGAKEGPEHITFAEFAENFWNTEGTYAQSRVAHLYTCSRGYLDIAESNTRECVRKT